MDAKRFAVLGTGTVGTALSAGLARHGHEIVLGTRDPSSKHAKTLLAEMGGKASAASQAEAVGSADWVFLCLPGTVAEQAVVALPAGALDGKIVVDVTNSLATGAAGQLTVRLGLDDSVTQRMQAAVPNAHFVKAFNTCNYSQMVDPTVECPPPTMPICGDSKRAKAEVAELLRDIGWEAIDLGGVAMAGVLETLTVAWVAVGRATSAWQHCYKLVRP